MQRFLRGTLICAGGVLAMLACNSSSGGGGTDASTADVTTADGTGAGDAPGAGDSPADGSDAAALSDGQIVGAIEAANIGEIEEAMLAVGQPDGGAEAGGGEAGAAEAGAGDGGDAGGADASRDAESDAADASVATAFDAGVPRSMNPAVMAFADMMISDHEQSNATVASFGITPTDSSVRTMLQTMADMTIAQLSPLSGGAFDVAYAQSQVAGHMAVSQMISTQLIPSAQNPQLKSYLSNTLLPTIQAHLAQARALLSQLTDGGAEAGAEGGGDARAADASAEAD